MLIQQLAAKRNLALAWRRITTSGNQQYKRFFRPLYYAYEIALEDNLNDLRKRLLGGAFKPTSPERVYFPKGSGLHRPITLLHLEDQIVLQAFANLAATRLYRKRRPLQLKVVFSNILQDEKSIFFLRKWQETYSAFQNKITKHYEAGLRWVADFDLAAFYDTVSHELLLQTVYPRRAMDNDEMRWLLKCLRTWSSDRKSSSHGHGLPQGPIASDFLAECFLLPIDLMLKGVDGYTRYVDDIRLFGRTEDDVRRSVVQLERCFRERGLIPQSGKFAIKKATSIRDAMGKLPSIAGSQLPGGPDLIPPARARKLLIPSIGGKPQKVVDKTRFRFVLFRAEPDARLLTLTLRLLRHHPEHADVLFTYLGRFGFRKAILARCKDIVDSSPYPYVRGEAWQLLATYLRLKGKIPIATRNELIPQAIAITKKGEAYFMERIGACQFLAASEVVGGQHHSRFLSYQPPLLQSFLADSLPDSAIAQGEAAEHFLRCSTCEPGLAMCGRLHGMDLTPNALGVSPQELPSQVCNTLRRLGVIQPAKAPIDPIAEILKARYGVSSTKSWHQLLGVEYVHALGLLRWAEATFYSGLSFWLASQNSFNHAIFLALQKHLGSIGDPGTVTTLDKKGHLVDFGVMLYSNGRFAKQYSTIADSFRQINDRRNHLPVSHPYEKKTAVRCAHLKPQERNHFVNLLRTAYQEFVAVMP